MINMQMANENFIYEVVGNLLGSNSLVRPRAYIKQKFVPVAQFDKVRDGHGCPGLVGHSSPQGSDPHFIGP